MIKKAVNTIKRSSDSCHYVFYCVKKLLFDIGFQKLQKNKIRLNDYLNI